MLEVHSLNAGYPSRLVLKDINASFKAGKLYILLGPNGSGKTTLLNTIGGWQKPFGGRVLVNGKDLFEQSDRQRAHLTGRMAQQTASLSMTVSRFVLLGCYANQAWINPYSLADYQKVDQVLTALKLTDLADRRMDQISSGQRQRAAIAQVLAQNPVCLLLDEPGSALDPSARFKLMETLVSLRAPNRVLLAIVHDLDLALRYGDELLVLDQGQLVFQGTGDELVRSHVVEDVFGLVIKDWDPDTRTGRIFPAACEGKWI